MSQSTANPFSAGVRFLKIFGKTLTSVYKINRATKQRGMGASEVNTVMQDWARGMLRYTQINLKVSGPVFSDSPAVFVGNHLSYLDIPVLMSITPVVFVAKKEISRWPVFGDACRCVGTVFVDRGAATSRKAAGEAIAETLRSRQVNVCLFPSGTTCLDESKPWRKGPFQIAKMHDLPIQPFRISYLPERATAFIDDDSLAPHIWALLRQGKVHCHIEFGERLPAGPPEQLAQQVWDWSRQRSLPTLTP